MCATRTRSLDRRAGRRAVHLAGPIDDGACSVAAGGSVDKSKHGQADRHDAASPRSPTGGIATLAEAKTRIPGGTGATQVTALVATKLLCIVPMIAVYVTAYLGLSILCGFAKPILGTKVLGPINLGCVLIALN